MAIYLPNTIHNVPAQNLQSLSSVKTERSVLRLSSDLATSGHKLSLMSMARALAFTAGTILLSSTPQRLNSKDGMPAQLFSEDGTRSILAYSNYLEEEYIVQHDYEDDKIGLAELFNMRLQPPNNPSVVIHAETVEFVVASPGLNLDDYWEL